MQQPYILGIDIGTGSTKAVAVNYKGEAFHTSQRYYPTISIQPGYHEQDPEIIWDAFVTCIEEVVETLKRTPDGISLSSAMHSVIPVHASGHPLSNMITWADSRSGEIADRLRASETGKALYETTGTPIYAMSPLSKVIWLKENQRGIFNQADKFISIKEFIWFKLFGEFQVDYSIACGTGFFDINNLKWNQASLEIAGIKESQLSEPVSTTFTRFDFHSSEKTIGCLPEAIPFIIGASDGCLANLGSGAIEPGIAAITIGTSGAVRISSKKPIYNFDAMTFNYVLDEDHFICGGPVNNGGIAVQWLLQQFEDKIGISPDDYLNLSNTIKTVEEGSGGLIFLPYLTGERAPVWDSKSCGVFFGIKLHHTKAYFSRAVIEGICYALNEILEAIEESSSTIKQLNVSGGFVVSKNWVQILSDITGKSICVLQMDDASSIGAAFLGIRALKHLNDYSSLPKPAPQMTILPDMNKHSIYQEHFLIYKKLYSSLKSSMHEVHQLHAKNFG
jgi:gluconokinase